MNHRRLRDHRSDEPGRRDVPRRPDERRYVRLTAGRRQRDRAHRNRRTSSGRRSDRASRRRARSPSPRRSEPRMERSSLPGDDDVPDAQRRVLRDVLDDDAGEIAARDAPPTSASDDRGKAARIIGCEHDRARKRRDGAMRPTTPCAASTPSLRRTPWREPLSIVTVRESFSGGKPMTRASIPW